MSKEKFTPGEWTVHEFYHEFSKQFLYNIYWSKDGEEVAERIYSKSDAYLMAASKEMYRRLQSVKTDLWALSVNPAISIQTKECIDIIIKNIEGDLKKARGEE